MTAPFPTLITRSVAKIGEKISIRRFARGEVQTGCVDTYIHLGGKIGVLVEVATSNPDNAKAAIHDVAMHIAAAKPTCLSRADVDQTDLDKEKEILKAQALNEPKPKPINIIEKMVEGRIAKYSQGNMPAGAAFREGSRPERRTDAQGRGRYRNSKVLPL